MNRQLVEEQVAVAERGLRVAESILLEQILWAAKTETVIRPEFSLARDVLLAKRELHNKLEDQLASSKAESAYWEFEYAKFIGAQSEQTTS